MLKSITLILLIMVSCTTIAEQLQIKIVSDKFMVEKGEYDPNLYGWLYNIQASYNNEEHSIKPMLNCKTKDSASKTTSCYIDCDQERQENISMLSISSGEYSSLYVYVDSNNQFGMVSTGGTCKIHGFTPMIDFDAFEEYEQ
jgi:hypothetical protein